MSEWLTHARGLAAGSFREREHIGRASRGGSWKKRGGIAGSGPEVAGQGYIVGFGQWVVDPDDPVKEGFFLR